MFAELTIQDALMRKAGEKWYVSDVIVVLSGETGHSRDAITKERIRLSEEKKLLLAVKLGGNPPATALRVASPLWSRGSQ